MLYAFLQFNRNIINNKRETIVPDKDREKKLYHQKLTSVGGSQDCSHTNVLKFIIISVNYVWVWALDTYVISSRLYCCSYESSLTIASSLRLSASQARLFKSSMFCPSLELEWRPSWYIWGDRNVRICIKDEYMGWIHGWVEIVHTL